MTKIATELAERNRDYYVVKSNELIQKARYNLTVQQQKLVLFAISRIKKNDDPRKYYTIPLKELCEACGFKLDKGGSYYMRLKEDFKKLKAPIGWVPMEDDYEWLVSWFDDVGLNKGIGTVKIRFHERIWPYLFNLQEKYTQYQLREVLVFKNKYAIRLFEILRSYYRQDELDQGIEKEIEIPLAHLRNQLNTDSYPDWRDFNKSVIKVAVDEINTYAEQINVTYTTKKEGHSIVSILFKVTAPPLGEKYIRYKNMKNIFPEEKKTRKKERQEPGLPW